MLKANYVMVLLIIFFVSNCGGPPRSIGHFNSNQNNDSTFNYSDEDIKNAFLSQPIDLKKPSIAVYNAGFSNDYFVDTISKLQNVSQVTTILPSLVSSENTSQYHNYYFGYYPQLSNTKRLRLLAAQSKSDLLLYTTTNSIINTKSNILIASYVLLITPLFVPASHLYVTTNVEMFLIDVRTGYIYKSWNFQESTEKRWVAMNYFDFIPELTKKNVEKLLPKMLNQVEIFLNK